MRAAARGARRPSRTSAAGRWAWLWRPPRRASPPSAGWCAAARRARRARAGAAAAQPPRRAAVSRGRAAAGVAFGHVVTQMRGGQHRRSAPTGAQKADSLCSSTVFLGVSRPDAWRCKICFSALPHAYRCGALPVPQAAAVRQRASAAEALPQPGAARLPSSHLHLSLTLFTALAVCMRVGAGDVRRLRR